MSDDVLRSEAMAALGEIIAQDIDLPDSVDRHQILIDVVNEAVGLGPREPLLADPTVTETMVNRHDEIFVESHGRLLRHRGAFSGEQAGIRWEGRRIGKEGVRRWRPRGS